MKTAYPIAIFWLGFLMAISFFEAPIKFQAPSVDLAEGLDIGRLVFFWFNKVEIVCLLLISASLLTVKENRMVRALIGLLALIIITQTLYLLPVLETRAMEIIQGNYPEDTNHHAVYVAMEVFKVVLLVWLSRSQMNSFRRRIVERGL